MTDISEREWHVLGIIAYAGGDDYDVWPWLDDKADMVALNALEDRGIVAVMGDGDICIRDGAMADEALRRWNAPH